ncbi:MAG: CoA transferase [Robiginitomaculum sp.]|nr:CoA transferase [Robiginitomaculum sp.]
MVLAFGVVAAVLKAKLSGSGSIVDAAMVDGAALLMCMPFGLKAAGLWSGGRQENLLDGGAPFYGTYQTSDNKWLALGAIEPPFWDEVCKLLELDDELLNGRMSPQNWPQLRQIFSDKIATKTRDQWVAVFEGSDACVTPVLAMDEVISDPHNLARDIFQNIDGIVQPAPAPRFSDANPNINPVDLEPHNIETLIENWAQD